MRCSLAGFVRGRQFGNQLTVGVVKTITGEQLQLSIECAILPMILKEALFFINCASSINVAWMHTADSPCSHRAVAKVSFCSVRATAVGP